MDERVAFLRRVARDLQRATGCSLVWKDADPARWQSMPADVAQHRNPACRAVKRDRERCRACSAHCNQALAADAPAPRLRSCPFGLREMVLPVVIDGVYQGQALIGTWRDERRPPTTALRRVWRSMPRRDDHRARAMARLLASALQQLPPADPQPAAADARLEGALSFIDAHLHSALRAGAVARELGLSSSRFVHWFKEASGRPYSAHLREACLRRAAGRLSRGEERIVDIALDLGFASHSIFTAAFRRHYGCTPSAFRRRCRSIA